MKPLALKDRLGSSHSAILKKQSYAALLKNALASAHDDASDERVRDVLGHVLASVKPAPDEANFEAATALMPKPLPRVPTNEPFGLILETRQHLNLPFVVRQVVSHCAGPIQLMHGPGNAAFVEARLGDLIAEGRVVPTLLGSDRLNGAAYNGLFLSRAFWDAMLGRGKVFVFQTDSMLCRRSINRLEDFLDFDFIGSRRHAGSNRYHMPIGVNGGFSLRDWQRSVRALERFEPNLWPAGEDYFYPLFIEVDGGRVANSAECDRFCGQRWFTPGCFGLHKPNFRKLRLAAAILSYEPGAWRLVTPVERWLARNR
jgi:hypothetical protein